MVCAVAVAGTVGGLVVTSAAAPRLLLDPGALVRWGGPLLDLVTRAGATVAVGALGLAAFVLPPGRATSAARQVAAFAALTWTLAQALSIPWTYRDIGGADGGLLPFLTTRPATMLVLATLLASLTALLAAVARSAAWTALATAVGVLALAPVTAAGHAGSSGAGHGGAVTALWLHVGAVALWVGGLAVLVGLVLRGWVPAGPRTRPEGPALASAARRFSALAGPCFAVVVASGAVTATDRLDSLGQLVTTPWGTLLLAKVVLLTGVGVAGAVHRRFLLGRLRSGTPRAFVRLAATEVLLMAVAVGLSVALGTSSPPAAPDQVATVPPLGPVTALTQWSLEPVTALAGCVGLVAYGRWVLRLRRRGDAWPIARTLAWTAAMVLLVWTTSGGPGVYGHALLSVHMVEHMALVTFLPVLYVLGSPLTLALRALPRRTDGSRGPREWLLAAVSSRATRVLLHPAVATANVVVSMAVFYLTPVARLSLDEPAVHLAAVVHFSVAGYLFADLLVGTDPLPRPPYPVRLLMLAPAMVVHTVLGLVLVTSTRVLLATPQSARDALARAPERLADQQAAGAVVWALGEIPAVGLALAVALQWADADARSEARRERRARSRPR